MTHTTTIYSKASLKVEQFRKGTFSHQVYCYCKTFGAENKERAYQLKKVNVYKFKTYVINVLGVFNFNQWYVNNLNTYNMNKALASYINSIENRQGLYIDTKSINTLDRLLIRGELTTNQLRARLNNVA